WTVGENAMPELAPWTAPGKTWAPEVLHREDGKYALYYTAASAASGKQCIGHALSDSPGGPFVDRDEEPFICQVDPGGSIDASPFVDDGTLYLFWNLTLGFGGSGGRQVGSSWRSPNARQ
ncbi:MAG: family 43 glycosylhydrolase, partial [Actinomycetota bacterium]|nr:family 43 glycosylhydrolase [Actinomycetota bacterium]